jgi:hypothetical protein
MGVAPGEPDKTQFLRFDPAHDIGGQPPLLVAPKPVSFDKCRLRALCHLQGKSNCYPFC